MPVFALDHEILIHFIDTFASLLALANIYNVKKYIFFNLIINCKFILYKNKLNINYKNQKNIKIYIFLNNKTYIFIPYIHL